jgi:hypothetical protein
MFATSTAVSLVNAVSTNVGIVLGATLVAIVGLLAALIGLGMGVRYFKRWIGGPTGFEEVAERARRMSAVIDRAHREF